MILIKNAFKIENLSLKGSWSQLIDVAGLNLHSSLGKIYFLSVYLPPNSRIKFENLVDLLGVIPEDAVLILSGDFNVHLASHAPYRLNKMGKLLLEIQD